MSADQPLFRKLLIANRGEVAVRVIRAARDLGIPTVAVYSEADRALPHVHLADEAFCIGPPPAQDSYLNQERILEVAERAGADALHPGYGFLSENAGFVTACGDAGLTFIGPSAASMEQMGGKINSRRAMQAAGVPIVPGTVDPIRDPEAAARIAQEIGYPVLIKASAGGGGKGIRVVDREGDLRRAMLNAQGEARAAFGDDSIFVEKLLRPARHIEIQLIADQHGNLVTLGERECSIQRRRQKLLEEAPSVIVTPDLRARLEQAATDVARACAYVNAGTVEFLVYDGDQIAFLEMNARLQVEHPITELVRGVDIVADQLRVAAGQPLGYTAADRPIRGWAMEARITAEDPYADFMPSIGAILSAQIPSGPGVRVDGMFHPGMAVSEHYDSLLAKLIVWGEDREQCRLRLRRALGEFQINGVATTIPFHRALLDDPAFIAGEIDTEYIERAFRLDPATRHGTANTAALAAAAFLTQHGERIEPPPARRESSSAWAAGVRGSRHSLEQGWRRT